MIDLVKKINSSFSISFWRVVGEENVEFRRGIIVKDSRISLCVFSWKFFFGFEG